jgi:hypothetical protein
VLRTRGGIATNLVRPQRTSHQALLTQQPETGRHRRAPEKRASYREVFAVREFRWLWVAQVLSFAGDQFAQVAIAILVFRRARSALIPDILSENQLVMGSAIGNITHQASQIVGFVTGAAVVATIGSYRTLGIDAGTFGISALIVLSR